MTDTPDPAPIDCVLIAGGLYHDFNYARLELLKLLHDDPRVRVRVFEDYETVAALEGAQLLVSYTCDVRPSPAAQEAIRAWVEAGGRWVALHGTNCILDWGDTLPIATPDLAPLHMDTLGSRFLSHPPIGSDPYRVEATDPDHPIAAGIASFETLDELYLMHVADDLKVVFHTDYAGGDTPNFAVSRWGPGRHPVLYLRPLGQGEVVYFTLGHCRGHYDMRPKFPFWPVTDLGSWAQPVFRELLKRSIDWAKREDAR